MSNGINIVLRHTWRNFINALQILQYLSVRDAMRSTQYQQLAARTRTQPNMSAVDHYNEQFSLIDVVGDDEEEEDVKEWNWNTFAYAI